MSTKAATIVPESSSRYKVAGKALDGQIDVSEVPGLVKSLRETFKSEKTYSYKWRISQLQALRRMVSEGEKELSDAIYADIGKSAFESFGTEIGTTLGEISCALDHLKAWMKPTKKGDSTLTLPSWSSTQRDPLGVVLIMGAWNYPVYLTLAPLVGAIAGGNCAILKPGSYSVNTSKTLAKLIAKYMDPDCFRAVEGNRQITTALLKEKFDKIFFTGSGFVGKVVARAAAEHLTPISLELGGKSPCIVDKSAAKHMEFTCERIVWGTFVNGGQTCIRPDFVLVDESIKGEFVATMKKTVKKFYSETPKESEWVARIINDGAFKRLSGLLKEHKSEIIVGGETDAKSKYIAPTILDFGTDLTRFENSAVMQDEIFGPILPMCGYRDFEQVIEFVKELRTGKPLSLYAFGTDRTFVEGIKKRTTSGGMAINDVLMHVANHELPFGGVGSSGMGSYHGKYSFECFTHEKAICEKSPRIEDSTIMRKVLAMRFPPYSKQDQQMMKSAYHPFASKVLDLFQTSLVSDLKKLLFVYLIFRVLGFKISRN